MRELYDELAPRVGRAVIGGEEQIVLMLCASALGGHVLLEGPPGTAKTLLASAYSRALGLSFRRLQFTPDMLPSDVTGNVALRGGDLVFREGPVFAQVVLADEINRTPPKTQAALLEAMEEGFVTVDGERHPLPQPFLVFATQNPIEYEGTYPLPEAQLDRFLFRARIDYPGAGTERAMLRLDRDGVRPSSLDGIDGIPDAGARLIAAREAVERVTRSDEVVDYVVEIVRKTRDLDTVTLGASPRAAVHLLAASAAVAALMGRDFITPDDVQRMATPVLAHRLRMAPEAELERVRPEDAVATALGAVAVPR